MANIFARIFKSKHEREAEQRRKMANDARSFDYGGRVAQTVTAIIDDWREEKLVPFAQEKTSTFKKAIERCHKDSSPESAFALLSEFNRNIEIWKAQSVEAVWVALGEWKYSLIETGLKTEFDPYIDAMFGNVWKAMNEVATDEMAYCLARQGGHITDEMHAMTPDEFGRFVRENKLGRFREV